MCLEWMPPHLSALALASTAPPPCCDRICAAVNVAALQLTHIAELAAPVAWQTADRPPKGRPDIQPILLACPPKTAEEVDAEHAAEQQQQQQQGGNNAGGQDDDMPALI